MALARDGDGRQWRRGDRLDSFTHITSGLERYHLQHVTRADATLCRALGALAQQVEPFLTVILQRRAHERARRDMLRAEFMNGCDVSHGRTAGIMGAFEPTHFPLKPVQAVERGHEFFSAGAFATNGQKMPPTLRNARRSGRPPK